MITREYYEAYTAALDMQYAEACQLMSDIIDSFDWDVGYEQKLGQKKAVVSYALSILDVYGNNAATLAADFYRESAFSQVVRVPEPKLADVADAKRLATSLGMAATHVFGAEVDVDAFRAAALSSMRRYVKDAATDTVKLNSMRDGLKNIDVRWARVPRGLETCAWCIMLASRGFVYASEETAQLAGHNHENCNCDVVASFDKDGLEGYDPEKYYRAYKDSADAVTWDTYRRWEELPDGERGKYDSFNDFQTREIVKEMRRRDVEWMNYGTPARTDYSAFPDGDYSELKDYEVAAWESLSRHGLGFKVFPNNPHAPASIDARYGNDFWELKNPGSGKHSMEDLVRDGVAKWRKLGPESRPKLIISNNRTDRDDDAAFKEALRRCKWYGVEEMLFVSHDGSWVRRAFL